MLLPEPTLRRLPWYLAYVEILHAKGCETVSSTQISQALSVEASQIAKDLSFIGIRGKTRIGYDVAELTSVLSNCLGFARPHSAFLMGVGSLGASLLQDSGLGKYGLEIKAGFDINPDLIHTKIAGVEIFHRDDLPKIQKSLNATIGILTVPPEKAQESADYMIGCGIKAIWNFTPYRVKVREGIVMANTSIYAHLALIYNRLAEHNID